MREGEGQTNELYFEKSNEKDSGRSTHVYNSKTSYSKRTSVSADFSQTLQESLSLFLAFVVKKIIGVAICPGRIWIERVSFEVPHVYTERTVSS